MHESDKARSNLGKKNIAITILYTVLLIGIISGGIFFLVDNFNQETGTFSNDGYAVVLDKNSAKVKMLSFKSGTTYNYNKFDDSIRYQSVEKENAKINDTNVIHYQDKSLMILKNMVGVNLSTIDNNIVFYYNIFKNTEIKYGDDKYYIKTSHEDEITFNPLLLRITDDKFLLVGKNVRCILVNDEIIDFGDYVYFEYANGSVVRIYNNVKSYQTVSEDAIILVDDVTISLKNEVISKNKKECITLSNLVIDMDSNVDVVSVKEEVEKKDISSSSVSENTSTTTDSNNGTINNGVNNLNGDDANEETEDSSEVKDPVYKVVSLSVTPMKLDLSFEIDDPSQLISSQTDMKIVENKTGKVVYEASTEMGDLYGTVSYPDLKPDTEYTFIASASYKKNDIEYEKSFISKIFRTESLGVKFVKSYVTSDSIVLDVNRENYSKVSSSVIGIYDLEGNQLDYKRVDFEKNSDIEIVFNELSHNTTYMIKMYDILCAGVIVDDGFSQKENISTLKVAPVINNLNYEVSKSSSTFKLNIENVIDKDYGIENYRYEIFDARQDMTVDSPIVTLNSKNLNEMIVKVDNERLHRGVAYTYRVVASFNDNEKIVEYISNLGKTMQIDGVSFPTLRFDESEVTWEHINGTIVIDDPAGTIMSNRYKVVYKNSIDVYTTMTITADTSRLSIPIAVNYLRANETYTFDVYASINLQDGNETADETYIGSVKVQTKKPNPFTASFTRKNNLTDIFSIDFQLTDDSGSAEAEADTLSSISFTLYQGSTVNGKVEVSKRRIDTNDAEYVSVLKEEFYDSKAKIDANFFNSENSDFKERVYTLVVDKAYDYTGYNEIPILNNEFQFVVNSYVPPLPDSDYQIVANPIHNRNAESFGLDYDDKLNLDTVVGYNVSAFYDNTTKNGRYIIYYVYAYNQLTNKYEKLENMTRRVDFSEDGTLPSTVFEVGYGTSQNVFDNDMLRRGTSYYFTYEAYLDVDNDGEVDVVYPTSVDDSSVLRSDTLSPRKQLSDVLLYPSSSDNIKFSWKYKIKDIDNVLDGNRLYGFVNANDSYSSFADVDVNGDQFGLANFSNLRKGNILTIKTLDRQIKKSEPEYNKLTSQYFYGYNGSFDLGYSVSLESNKVVLSFDNYSQNVDLVDSIAYVEVEFRPVNQFDLDRLGIITINDLNIVDGKIIVNLYDIYKYINCNLDVNLFVYYDTGGTGFDYNSDYKAVQKGSYDEVGNYYTLNNNNNLVQSSLLYGNIFDANFALNSNKLYLKNLQNKSYTMDITNDSTGIVFKNNNIVLKEIKMQQLSSQDKQIIFDTIIPGISLVSSNNKQDITSLLTEVLFNGEIFDSTDGLIKEDKVFIEFYTTDENGTNMVYSHTVEKEISDFDRQIRIGNLLPRTNYAMKFYVNLFNNETNMYEKVYLYDLDQNVQGANYYFNTLSDIGISDVSVNISSTSYTDKKLVIDYKIKNVSGYDRIEYKLLKKVNDTYVDSGFSIPDSTVFFNSMHISIPIVLDENNVIRYGEEYALKISPIAKIVEDGVDEELDLGTVTEEFKIDNYIEPYIGISSGRNVEALYFRVSIVDYNYLIVDGVYDIELVDENGVVVVSKENLSINDINKRFTFKYAEYNLDNLMSYRFFVRARIDRTMTHSNFSLIEKSKSINTGSSVNLGTVTLSQNGSESNVIDVIFSDSYQLNKIDKISYTVVSANSGYYYSNTSNFSVRYNSEKDLYYYTIYLDEEGFDSNSVYIVGLNFYDNNTLIDNIEIDYYSGGNNA